MFDVESDFSFNRNESLRPDRVAYETSSYKHELFNGLYTHILLCIYFLTVVGGFRGGVDSGARGTQ